LKGPLASAALALLASAAAAQAPATAKRLYRDVTTEAGITFRHHADPEKKSSWNR
jgi:hypothetical protein